MDEEIANVLLSVLDQASARDAGRSGVLGGLAIEDFEKHARGLRPFPPDDLRQIRAHPVRRKLLEAFERQYAVERTGSLWDRMRRWRDEGGLFSPVQPLEAKIERQDHPPEYPLLVERPGGIVQNSSFRMLFPASVTPDGFLVCKVGLNEEIARVVASPVVRAELVLVAAVPEGIVLGRVPVSGARPYVKIEIPADIRALSEWKGLGSSKALPFALVLRLTEPPLEASTLRPPVPPVRQFAFALLRHAATP
jgi:hypothetical protein